MERGAARFFATLPEVTERIGDPEEHLTALVEITRTALEEHPDFLRLLVTLATQPHSAGDSDDVRTVVNRVRDEALVRLRDQLAIAFERRRSARVVDDLARFTLAVFDGAFVAAQSDPSVTLASITGRLPRALVALHDAQR
jgi:hypothetical protein